MAIGFKNRKTPGVYVTELQAFPKSIVGVPTAVPAFIGYTEKAEENGKPIFNKPVKIDSMVEFERLYGGAHTQTFKIEKGTDADYDFRVAKKDAAGAYDNYTLTKTKACFYLHRSLQLFYDNGGGDCYIVSVGKYDSADSASGAPAATDPAATPPATTDPATADPATTDPAAAPPAASDPAPAPATEGIGSGKVEEKYLKKGLDIIAKEKGPTMLVVPDAVLVSGGNTDYVKLMTQMLDQAKKLQDRVAILDVLDGDDQAKMTDAIDAFRTGVGIDNDVPSKLSYGIAYYPWLNANVISKDDINYTYIDASSQAQLKTLVTDEAKANLEPGETAIPKEQEDMINNIKDSGQTPNEISSYDQALNAMCPVYSIVETAMAKKLNVLPTCGGIAGVYSMVDANSGVWQAPANVSIATVISPTVRITDKMQENMNVPINGKAVNAIRSFTDRDNVIWGSRTLDGNSRDWRYVNIRRTLVYIEQTLKQSMNQFVFEANDSSTWTAVKSMAESWLNSLWERGGLMGDKASDAFSVTVGLGSTMTANDILDGYMIVQIMLQMVHPVEFIELTIKQKMSE